MTGIGSGVREIRVRDEMGAFRVIYLAALAVRLRQISKGGTR